MNILLLDFCSEKNRGDAAMQVGLIKLVRKYFPKSKIKVITVFGSNQQKNLKKEFDHTKNLKVSLLGGLRPTSFPMNNEKRSLLLIEVLNALSTVYAVFLLFIFAIRLPENLIYKLVPKNYHNTLEALFESDIVIWNGRNFRSRKNNLLEFYRMVVVVFHPLICVFLKKRMICVGASVWDLNFSLTQKLLKYVFSKLEYLTVRESNSFKTVKKLMPKNFHKHIYQLPDLSFAAFDLDSKKPITKKLTPKNFGITLVDWQSDGAPIRENYKLQMTNVIKALVNKNASLTVYPQVTKGWEGYDEIFTEIKGKLTDKELKSLSHKSTDMTIEQLVNEYSKLDFLIATRMHSAIFACIAGTPVICIAYDKGGKWAILEGIGIKKYIIPYSEVNSDKLLKLIESFWKDKKNISPTVYKNTKNAMENVEKHVSLLLK